MQSRKDKAQRPGQQRKPWKVKNTEKLFGRSKSKKQDQLKRGILKVLGFQTPQKFDQSFNLSQSET